MKIGKFILISFVSLAVIWIFSGGCTHKTASVSSLENVAIKGYDTVAYFKEGRAVEGSPSHAFKWHGMNWLFSSQKNRDLFAGSPEMYAPQYDGFCAWAMTEKRKAITDPEVWRIVDGKLYLNCSRSAYEKWIQDIPGNIKKADANWLELSSEK